MVANTNENVIGIDSGIMFNSMSTRLVTSGWHFESSTSKFAFYPQLSVFKNNENTLISDASVESVKINVSDGLGNAQYPFIIYTKDDLEILKTKIENGNTFEGFYFKISDDYTDTDLGNFSPIGINGKPFYGSFDGNNKQFRLERDTADSYQGLFGRFGKGTIQNLSVTGSIKAGSYVGGIVGYQESGLVTNVYNLANIEATSYVGGIVGYLNGGTIDQTYNHGDINASGDYIGGISGHLNVATLDNSYNRGEILGRNYVGGILGHTYLYVYRTTGYSTTATYIYVRNNYSAGLVSGTKDVGGVIGGYNKSRTSYSGSPYTNQTTRTNLYYDVSVIVNYDQPRAIKPDTRVTGNQYTTDKLVYASASGLGFNSDIWFFESKNGTTAYYPQLKAFVTSSVERIRNESRASTAYEVGDGLGTKDYPFIIRNKFDMDELSRKVREGNTFIGYHFKVDDGIDNIYLGNFIPIGNTTTSFKGSFDGNGVNFDLAIDTQTDYVGLFGVVDTGIIENLSTSGSVVGRNQVGAIAGQQNSGSTIRNVYNTADVTGNTRVGGIVGFVNIGTLTNMYNRGKITGNTYVGGLVGYTYLYVYRTTGYSTNQTQLTISSGYSSGEVSAVSNVGGVIGGYNTSRTSYSGSPYMNKTNRVNLYYDITVIANYDQPSGQVKPSMVANTNENVIGIDSGIMFNSMSTRLVTSGWHFESSTSKFAFYPQLSVFKNNENTLISDASVESVKINVSDGLGNAQYPFIIYTKDDLEILKTKIENGNTFEGFYFKISDDYTDTDLGNFSPIGINGKPFYGSFDGNNKQFRLERDTADSYQGLFGRFGKGTIQNLSVTGSIKAGSYVGGIVGYQESGIVRNVYSIANIEAVSYVGGIVGYLNGGTIDQTYNHGDITATGDYVGGISGHLNVATLDNSYNRGTITGRRYVGGILGHTYYYIYRTTGYSTKTTYLYVRNNYSAGLVSGTQDVGGVIGGYNKSRTSYSGSPYTNQTTRTNLYYDVSVIESYIQPTGKIKPSSAVGGQGLDKVSMFESQMASKGFSETIWTFKSIEGNYAYYPQLKVFATSENERIVSDSINSVKTNPFMGDGTKASPYLIRTASDMEILSKAIGSDYDAFGIYYQVASGVYQIDLTTVDFKGIGNSSTPFRGHFDGSFINFIIDLNSDENYRGLFGRISSDASVSNLSVTGSIIGGNYVGAIVGYNEGMLSQVYAKVDIEGKNYVGGLVGYNKGTIEDVFQTGNIIGRGSYIGGLIGYNEGSIREGYFGGKIHGASNVGGIIGHSITADFENVHYNQTIIFFDDIIEGVIKPTKAINNLDIDLGLEKEDITGLEVFDGKATFDPDKWVLTQTNSLYDYYPQLKVFVNNTNAQIKTYSSIASRVIRFAKGNGTKNNPYIIRDEDDMKALSDITVSDTLQGLHFRVMDGVEILDLTNPNLGFVKIGRSNAANQQFRGSFDGNGVTILLNINTSTTNYAGLFGYIGQGSEIKNLTIKGNVTGQDRVGGLAGEISGATISNVFNHAIINGRQYVGGIAGVINDTQISQSYNMANVTSNNRDIGGLIGWGQRSSITNSFNYGDVKASLVVGGIIGYANNNMTIRGVYNRGAITSTVTSGSAWIGGIIGASYTNTYLYDSYSAGSIIARRNDRIGGLVGGVSGVTHEENSYYDQAIIDAVLLQSGEVKPTQAIFNKLNQETVRGLSKAYLVGSNGKLYANFSDSVWTFKDNEGAVAYYPQLKVFATHLNDYVKLDSLESVSSYVFVGEGTQQNPYIIVTSEDMQTLSRLVKNGISFTNKHFKVKDDIDEIDLIYGINFEPIGNEVVNFEGIFDGTGTNFILDLKGAQNNVGLFGVLGIGGEVRNVSVSGKVKGLNNVGSIAGYNKGLIENVYSTASITGDAQVGGLVGYNNGILNFAYTIGEVLGKDYVGGIAGYNSENGIIEDVYSSASIFGKVYLGGAIGFSLGNESNVYYNKSKVEVSIIDTNEMLYKPQLAISNKLEDTNITGVTSNDLYSGFVALNTTHYKFDQATGFYAYYPQLKVFANSKYPRIATRSRDSVTVNKFNEGDGTKSNPYIIRNEFDMEAISQMTQNRYTLANIYFKVADDVDSIDLSNLRNAYVPIGNNSYHFQGNFDGNGVVFVVDINRPTTSYQGIFGVIGSNGYVSNIGVTGSVKAYDFAGGISGRNYGIITNSYNMANIYVERYYAGGISGWNNHTIDTVFNTGHIIAKDRYAGGITGGVAKNNILINAYNTGLVESQGVNNTWTETGGIAGYTAGTIKNVYNAGNVVGRNSYIGHVVGRVEGDVVFENASYVIENIDYLTTIYRKPTQGIGNATLPGVYAVYKNQLTGDEIFNVELDKDRFTLKQSQELLAYYPQLTYFETSNRALVKVHSLQSVSHDLFHGSGTVNNPYMIHSSFDLRALGIVVKQGFDTIGKHFMVSDKAVIDFEPIKNNYVEIGNIDNPFNATFNGNNILMSVAITHKNKDYQGVFGYIGEQAYVHDIYAKGYVEGNNYTGFIAGYNLGKLEHIILDNITVTGNNYVGGLAGFSSNVILLASVDGVIQVHNYGGGLVGHLENADISMSYFIGSIEATGNNIAGLIATTTGEVHLDHVFASGTLNALNGNNVAGLVIELNGSITNAYVTMDIVGYDNVSGIVTVNNGAISEVFYSGSLKSNGKVAGVVITNNNVLESAYYNETEISRIRNTYPYNVPTSAVYEEEDTIEVGSRKLEDMTAYFALGSDETQMNFEPELYHLKQGYDFTLYFPELIQFRNYNGKQKDIYIADSLASITYKKIDGSGTKNDPFLIYDGFDMMIIYDYVKDQHLFLNKYFKVAPGVSEIDLTVEGLDYLPIGTIEYHFNGIFDGNNATFIIDFNENLPYQGIFNIIGEQAVISNMTIRGSLVGLGYSGSLAAVNLGKVENITNYASVTGMSMDDGGNDIGGIIGTNRGTILHSMNNGIVTSKSSYAGGIAGQNLGTIIGGYNRADVTGLGNVGGITGINYEEINGSYNIGNVQALGDIVGGIAGSTYGVVKESYNFGEIIAKRSVAGGIVGLATDALIINTYNGGKVLAENIHAGGLIGYAVQSTIEHSRNFGSVFAVDELGSLIGYSNKSTLMNTYYDLDQLNLDKTTGKYKKPVQAIGNISEDTYGKYHGQMIGNTAVTKNNLNLDQTLYTTASSILEYSFYPQLKVFADHTNITIKNDSLESVRTITFIVGKGIESEPYLIRNESDWIALADSTTSGNHYTGIYFVVDKTIDTLDFSATSDYKFAPVGTYQKPFNGILDGQGIKFHIEHTSNQSFQALFGHIGSNGIVRNVAVLGSITGKDHTAGIAALNEGTIEQVFNTATIKGTNYTSGIVSENLNTVRNVYNQGYIEGLSYTAGIAGYVEGYVHNTYNIGIVYGTDYIGALVGFYQSGNLTNSYYDETILNSYRSTGQIKKPESAVGSSYNGSNVKGLDKRFMTGITAIGTGSFNMNFVDSNVWVTQSNIVDQSNYPQLKPFATDTRETIRNSSFISTRTELFKVTFDEQNDNISAIVSEISPNVHYQLYVPTYYGYDFVGWFYNNGEQEIQVTNGKGESLKPWTFEHDIEVYAKWTETYHLIQFVNGENKVIYETEVRHGLLAEAPSGIIPTKNRDSKYVYEFIDWDFDFDTIIEAPQRIKANYKTIDRYYNITFLDGNGDEFLVVKAEYEKYLTRPTAIPTKEYHDNDAYRFVDWNFNFNQIITGALTIEPVFERVDRYYTVRFFNGDELIAIIDNAEYLFGVNPPEGIPQKQSTISHTYTFAGWDKDFSKITSDLDVHAVFTEKLRVYTVTFKYGDNIIYTTEQVGYGNVPAIPAGRPYLEPSGHDAYKFTGWDYDFLQPITSDITILGKFERVDRYYTVTFYDAYENIISTQTHVEYLKSAEEPTNKPEKLSTQSHTYTFIGWDKDFSEVTENLHIYPEYKEMLRSYNVYFYFNDVDNKQVIYSTQSVLYGYDATVPFGKPFKDGTDDIGYKFIGWDDNYHEITEDTYVLAQFEEVQGKYVVTFMHNGQIIGSDHVKYGHSAKAPVIDYTHPTEGYEYYFISWSHPFDFVESDITTTLTLGSRLKTFTVTIINGDETIEQMVEWGKDAKLPTPYKTSSDQITYTFIEWDTDHRLVKEDRTITAIFEANYHYYEVRFYDGNGELIKLEHVVPGESAHAPNTATQEPTDEFVFIHIGWDKDFSEVTENLNVYARFTKKERYLNVTFLKPDGSLLEKQVVEYGKSVIIPPGPSRDEEGRFKYDFIGWSLENDEANTIINLDIITDNLTLKPVYEQTVKMFVVNFIDGDGKVIKSELVEHGANAVAPTNPSQSATDDKVFIFSHWDKTFTNVTENLDVYAKFTSVNRYYDVEFIDKDGNVVNRQVVEYEQSAIDPIPIINYFDYVELDDTKLYVIVGWDKDFDYVTENLKVYAIYGYVDRYYTVTFTDDLGNEIMTYEHVEYGSSVHAPDAPIKVSDDELYFYQFTGWDKDFTYIRENLSIAATYKLYKKVYTVVFLNGDGEVMSTQEVPFGEDAYAPGIPFKSPTLSESFIFIRWDKEFTNVQEDLIITPVFEATVRTFTVIFKDHMGNILSEQQVIKGSNAIAPTNIMHMEPTPYYEFKPVWSHSFENVQEDLMITLSYEMVERIYKATFYDDRGNIIKIVTGTYEQFISAPEAPEKPMTNKYIYEFNSYYPTFNEYLTEDVEYFAVYDEILRHFTVRFIDGNGEVFEEQTVAYGQMPTKPVGIPEKEMTAQHIYTFRMWETTTIKVYQDVDIHALFYSELRQYRVTFIDENGNILSVQMVEYGKGALEPDNIPTKPHSSTHEYSFQGWDKPFNYITEEITVQTVYLGAPRKYVYEFYLDDHTTLIKRVVGYYDDPIIAPSKSVIESLKEGTDYSHFVFIEWDRVVAATLMQNEVYYAVFEEKFNEYNVVFLDGNDNVFDIQRVEHFKGAIDPTTYKGHPTKRDTLQDTFTFSHWSTSFDEITGDIIIKSVFTRSDRLYKVTFLVQGNEWEVAYVKYAGDATREAGTPVIKGHSFAGWDKDLYRITEDTVTNARFNTNIINIYFDTGVTGDDMFPVFGTMKTIRADFGEIITIPEAGFIRKGFVLKGWIIEGDDYPSIAPNGKLEILEETYTLIPYWVPEEYDIDYETDGGIHFNNPTFTADKDFPLLDAEKEDHAFVGWYLTETDGEYEEGFIDVIKAGTIFASIKLVAIYEYTGYIQLKEESMLGLYHAELSVTEPIHEREEYNDDHPVYLLGVFLGQTISNLRENFINNDLIFVDAEGKELNESDVVATGYQVIAKNSNGEIIDRIHIVLKGDTNGDGRITVADTNIIKNHISKKNELIAARIIAADINGDGRITVADTNMIMNHISNKTPLWDKDMTSTLRGGN